MIMIIVPDIMIMVPHVFGYGYDYHDPPHENMTENYGDYVQLRGASAVFAKIKNRTESKLNHKQNTIRK